MGPRVQLENPDLLTATYVVATDGSGHFETIQAAIDALSSAAGKIFVKAGTYVLGATALDIPQGHNGLEIIGESKSGTIITYSGSSNMIDTGDANDDTRYLRMGNMKLVGSGSANSGLRLNRVKNSYFENLWFSGFSHTTNPGRGLYLSGTGSYTGDNSFYGLLFDTCQEGITMVTANANHFFGGVVRTTKSHADARGINLSSGTANQFYGFTVETCTTGVRVNSDKNYFAGFYFEDNTTAISFTASANHNKMDGMSDVTGNATFVSDSGTNNKVSGGDLSNEFVVATDGSGDYNCDGTADDVQIQAALDALTSGRTWKEKVTLKGLFTITAILSIPSYTILDLSEAILSQANGADLFRLLYNSDPSGGNIAIDIIGGIIDGNKANQGSTSLGINFNKVTNSHIYGTTLLNTYSETIFIANGSNNTVGRVTVTGSGKDGIVLSAETNSSIRDECNVSGSTESGLVLANTLSCKVLGNTSNSNTHHGIDVAGASATDNIISGNTSNTNTRYGIYNGLYPVMSTISDNTGNGNGYGGIGLEEIDSGAISFNSLQGNRYGIDVVYCNNLSIMGNPILLSDRHGIHLTKSSYNQIIGNPVKDSSQDTNNTYSGIMLEDADGVNSTFNKVADNIVRDTESNKAKYSIEENAGGSDNNTIEGNTLNGAVTAPILKTGVATIVRGNNPSTAVDEADVEYMKNTSGASVAVGDVVTIKAVAAGNEFTTSSTEGDQLVYGMATAIIADNAWGYIQTLGKTIALKVDGTDDISIGDLISCFSTSKIGQKAHSGHLAIAIALEAYTSNDSSGVIDALLISPRQAL